MRRGTTPTHTFRLPFNTEIIEKLKLTYSQCGEKVLEKNTQDCALDENRVIVRLKQEETLRFNEHEFVKIQLKILAKDGSLLVSKFARTEIGDVFDEEVLV